MSGAAGAATLTAVQGLGLDTSRPWHQRSRAPVPNYLITSSVLPTPAVAAAAAAGGGGGRRRGPRGPKAPLRLPSLVGPCEGSSIAHLSFSEPSLSPPNDNVHFEGFSSSWCPNVLQKQPLAPFSKSSALLPSRTDHPSGSSRLHQQQNQQQVHGYSRPAYIHFSQAVQPISRPRPAKHQSSNPTLGADTRALRPLAALYRNSLPQGVHLSVIGRPCLLSCSQRPALAAAAATTTTAAAATTAAGPARTQLHVFLPTQAEGEEADSESVDEGFMDELDSKTTSLKLQQAATKTVTYD